MNRVILTHTLNGSTQAIAIPLTAKYTTIRNRNASAWRVGFDSTGTLYLAMSGSDVFEEPYHEGQTIQQIYVYGTGGHVLEAEYWL